MFIQKLDERAKKLAEIVVDYSTEVKKGDLVRISGEVIALEFLNEIARRVIDRGGIPIVETSTPDLGRYFIDHADMEQIVHLPKYSVTKAEETDAIISVDANMDPLCMQGADGTKMAEQRKSRKILSDIIVGDGDKYEGKRWCVVGYPTKADANMGGLNLRQWSDAVFGATNIDWANASKRMKRIKEIFDGAEDIHIWVPQRTDLHMSLKGRGGNICDGKFNMPDGEVFYGPVEDSVEGVVTFVYPAIREGNEVSGIELKYENGQLVANSAKKNQKFLESQLAIEGADRIGELGIGSNPGITRYMKNLLFDEKIDGTIHLAVGMSYPMPLNDGGGLNKSALHWDLVCELRQINGEPGGKIYVDGNLVQENGIWVFEK